MLTPKEFNQMEKALRALGRSGRMGIRFADQHIPGERFFVAFDCENAVGGEVRGCAATLENAFYAAAVRLEDADRKAA